METGKNQINLVTRNGSQKSSESPESAEAFDQILLLLSNFYAVMGNPPEVVGALNGMAGALLDESATVEQVAIALKACRRVQFPVRLPHILERLPGHGTDDGRLGVEAAWAMCPRTEEVSVVWTTEMAEAFGLCRPLLLVGDDIGARMVFKEQYPQIVARARGQNAAIQWVPSLGWDPNDRVRALSEAIEKKRITLVQAYGLLGESQQDELLSQLPVGERKLLTGKVQPNMAILSGFQKTLVALKENCGMPELTPRPERVALTDEQLVARKQMLLEQAEILRKRYTENG